MLTNIFHDVYPFTVTTLILFDGGQVALHADYITERERVLSGNFRQSTRVESPPIVAAFVLHTNISLVRNAMHRANLDFKLEN